MLPHTSHFLTISNNMVDIKIFEVEATLVPLNLWAQNDAWQ